MYLSYGPENPRPHDLGVVVHGPVLVAGAPGVAVAVRCVFALPTGLALDLILRASGVQAKAARRQERPSGTEPVITITADGITAIPQGSRRGSWSDDYFVLDIDAWVDATPADRRLTVAASWPAIGLPGGEVTITLAPADDLVTRVLHLP